MTKCPVPKPRFMGNEYNRAGFDTALKKRLFPGDGGGGVSWVGRPREAAVSQAMVFQPRDGFTLPRPFSRVAFNWENELEDNLRVLVI